MCDRKQRKPLLSGGVFLAERILPDVRSRVTCWERSDERRLNSDVERNLYSFPLHGENPPVHADLGHGPREHISKRRRLDANGDSNLGARGVRGVHVKEM